SADSHCPPAAIARLVERQSGGDHCRLPSTTCRPFLLPFRHGPGSLPATPRNRTASSVCQHSSTSLSSRNARCDRNRAAVRPAMPMTMNGAALRGGPLTRIALKGKGASGMNRLAVLGLVLVGMSGCHQPLKVITDLRIDGPVSAEIA